MIKWLENCGLLHENVTMWHGIRATAQIYKRTAFERPARGI